MDDFSWGNTRIVVGEKGNKKIVAGTDDEPYDDSMIPLKKFSEYQRDVWDAGSIRSGLTGQSGSPFGNPPGMQSGPPSMYKGMGGGSVHGGGSHAGSDYGGADYYQNTNVLASRPHSRQMSGNMSGYAGSHGPSRMPSMAFGAGAPPQSMYGMPGVSTPPSMYGMPAVTGSMYGMPAASQSMYGMPPASVPAMYGMPTPGGGFTHSPSGSDGGQQRMSTMSLQQQSTGGGMWGMGAGSVSRPMSTFSSGNLFGAPSPSLAQLTANPTNAPTDDEIVSAVRTYLSSQPNLMNVTKRSAREAVIASFPNADLTDRKAFINEKIDSVLAGAS